jgi:hypothetical protein
VTAIGVAVRAAGIELTSQNVEMVTVNCIPMVVVLLLSRSPFAGQAGRSPSPTPRGQDEGDGVGARRAGQAEHARRGEHRRDEQGGAGRLSDGSVKFHDDGYTAVRGRFDDGSVSTPERQAVERVAVLVLGDDRGAATREAPPPQQ